MTFALKFASWNEGVPDWNALTEDTNLRSFILTHKFNQPAECVITLKDLDGTGMQKFNADVNDTYIGSGKVDLANDADDLFMGRIKRVIGNQADKTITLECKDWLDQLDDEKITYDMREKLGTTDLRQSKGRSDVDGERLVVYLDGGVPSYLFSDDGEYDDDGGMGFANDQHNGQWLIFTTGMAGTKTWTFHPFDSTATDHDIYNDDVNTLWVDDNSIDGGFANNDWTLEYHFQVELGHNTPSDFYVHDSITAARIIATWQIPEAAVGNHSHIEVYENDGPSWIEVQRLEEGDHRERDTWVVSQTELPDVVDNTGQFNIRFNMDRTALNLTMTLFYLAVELDVTTTGYSTPVLINDTHNPNLLRVVLNMTQAPRQMWEGVPYCICKEIYLHLESASGPIGGGDTVVELTYGAANIENTTGISTTQFKNKSRLNILKSLAQQDKSMFYIELGETTVIYVQTFGADTAQITDGDVESWTSIFDYDTMFNAVDVYGARIGDAEIFAQGTNAASQTTFKTAKSKVLKNAGLVSLTEAEDLAEALAASDSTLRQQVTCTVKGLDTLYRLGTVVEITSSYLWPTAAKDYIVTGWSYDSSSDMTSILFHPKVSIGLQELRTPGTEQTKITDTTKRQDADGFVPDPITHEVA